MLMITAKTAKGRYVEISDGEDRSDGRYSVFVDGRLAATTRTVRKAKRVANAVCGQTLFSLSGGRVDAH